MVNWSANNSLRQVRDLFCIKYPQRHIPRIKTISKILNHFKSKGYLISSHNKRHQTPSVLTEDVKINILCYVEENPIRSLRQIANEFSVSMSTVRKVLKEFHYKCFKFQHHQQLLDNDMERRTHFCEILFNIINENENILQKIVFTDEASFSLNGTVNSQNYRLLFPDYCSHPFLMFPFLFLIFPDIGPNKTCTFKFSPRPSITKGLMSGLV